MILMSGQEKSVMSLVASEFESEEGFITAVSETGSSDWKMKYSAGETATVTGPIY